MDTVVDPPSFLLLSLLLVVLGLLTLLLSLPRLTPRPGAAKQVPWSLLACSLVLAPLLLAWRLHLAIATPRPNLALLSSPPLHLVTLRVESLTSPLPTPWLPLLPCTLHPSPLP